MSKRKKEVRSYLNSEDENKRKRMSNKTPIMILTELMVKRKCTPEFNLINQTGGTHDPIFEYIVRTDSVTAKGVGRSKKDAKHDAAKNALKKLAEMGIYDPTNDVSGIQNVSPQRDSPEMFDRCQANYVGNLKEFCCEKRLPDPYFEIISDIGPPHARNFTMKCSVLSIQCIATCTTKKLAKQQVSRKMLQLLIDTLDNDGIIVPYEDMSKYDQEAREKRNELKMLAPNLSRKISEYPRSLKEIDENLRIRAKEILKSNDEVDLKEKLENVINSLEITHIMESLPSTGSKVGLSIRLNCDPPFEIAAYGQSASETEVKVINNTLNFLNIMLV